MNCEAELKLAKRAAAAAGERLCELASRPLKVLSTEGHDIKIQADREAENVILAILSETGYPVLAEESGEHGTFANDAPGWVVDPLDGTMNFARGLPINCVSIALCRGEEPVCGVIHDFNRGECFSGVTGEGAWLNEVPISVASTRSTGDAVLSTGFPAALDMESDTLRDFLVKARAFKKVRMLGSAALSLAYVACGRVDAYVEEEIMFWDVAAGLVLVRAAGGHAEVIRSSRSPWGRTVRCAASVSIFS